MRKHLRRGAGGLHSRCRERSRCVSGRGNSQCPLFLCGLLCSALLLARSALDPAPEGEASHIHRLPVCIRAKPVSALCLESNPCLAPQEGLHLC